MLYNVIRVAPTCGSNANHTTTALTQLRYQNIVADCFMQLSTHLGHIQLPDLHTSPTVPQECGSNASDNYIKNNSTYHTLKSLCCSILCDKHRFMHTFFIATQQASSDNASRTGKNASVKMFMSPSNTSWIKRFAIQHASSNANLI